MAQAIETEPIVVQNRTFHPAVNTTFEQDMYVMEMVDESDIGVIANVSDADLNNVAKKIVLAAYKSGNLFKILAGMLVEEGKVWSRASSEANADFFSKLTDSNDKSALHDAMAGVILSFFVNAGGFLPTSPKSSGATNPGTVERHRRKSREKVEEQLISGNGTK